MYHQQWQTAEITAGLYNANGGIEGKSRPAIFTDFHPEHARDEEPEVDDSGAMDMLISRAAIALDLVDVNHDSSSD